MTLQQVKTLIIGVLKGWLSNKKVLDKFTESEDGTVLYDGEEITGGDTFENAEILEKFTEEDGKLLYNGEDIECVCPSFTDEEVEAAIAETIAALNDTEETEA